jgi:hypothetical protein
MERSDSWDLVRVLRGLRSVAGLTLAGAITDRAAAEQKAARALTLPRREVWIRPESSESSSFGVT